MTPEEINRRIAEWAGRSAKFMSVNGVTYDQRCEQFPKDYYGSNAAMDLLVVLVERGYKVDLQSDGPQWSMVLQQPDMRRSVCSLRDTIPAAICTTSTKVSATGSPRLSRTIRLVWP